MTDRSCLSGRGNHLQDLPVFHLLTEDAVSEHPGQNKEFAVEMELAANKPILRGILEGYPSRRLKH